jgi:acetylornithine deacetylase
MMLNGHVDVVPAGDEDDWPQPPWSGAVIDGRLWGRGSSDMKGGLVAGIGALKALQRAGLAHAGEIIFESVTDEEVGGPGTRSAIERGYRADAVIVLEPTSGQLCPVEGGLEWLDLKVSGVAGHSAQRYRSIHAGGQGTAVNAIEKAARILAAIQEYERHRGNTAVHPLMPRGITTINPGMIAGGSGGELDGMPRTTLAYSNMSDFCVIGLSLKYLPTERGDEVRAEFEEYIAAVAATDPWLRDHPPTIEWGRHGVSMPPAETKPDHPFLRVIESASRDVTGEANWTGFEAKTDLCWLVEAGIPGLIYGPGAIDQAHGASEYIELDELRTATTVVALTIARWCGVSA